MGVDLQSLFDRMAVAEKMPKPRTKADDYEDHVDHVFTQVFAEKLPGYEPREPQLRLSKLVARGLADEHHVLAEAGTGTGKSLAVLVPAIHHALETGYPVIVSTGTIALQEQYAVKDIPFLQSVLPTKFQAFLAKGKGNYLCQLKHNKAAEDAGQQKLFVTNPLDGDEVERLLDWGLETATGDKADLNPEPKPDVWTLFNVDDTCIGRKCPFFGADEDSSDVDLSAGTWAALGDGDRDQPFLGSCFYYKAKDRIKRAQIIVCNHHLFFADMAIKIATQGSGGILPQASAVIFDEAHHVESIARDSLGWEISNFAFPSYLKELKRLGSLIIDPELFGAAQEANDALFDALAGLLGNERSATVPEIEVGGEVDRSCKLLTGALRIITDQMAEQRERLDDKDAQRVGKQRQKILLALSKLLETLDPPFQRFEEPAAPDPEATTPAADEPIVEHVRWIEREVDATGQTRKVILRRTPLQVAPLLRRWLYSAYPSVVMTSATISTGRDFRYLKGSIGCDQALELIVDSPFDYWRNCLLYVPEDLPSPQDPRFHELIAPRIEEIIMHSNGRAFVLFTSFRGLNTVYDLIASRLRWQVLRQGDAPKNVLIDRFKQDGSAVLFGTRSFWEGIDVQGEALSCVIIDKLPFAVPNDPVEKARAAALEQRGRSAFFEISVPEAVIHIKQAFGRLIRTRTDRGIVAILDNRLITKSYGRTFLTSLPRCRRIGSLTNVEAFLESGAAV